MVALSRATSVRAASASIPYAVMSNSGKTISDVTCFTWVSHGAKSFSLSPSPCCSIPPSIADGKALQNPCLEVFKIQRSLFAVCLPAHIAGAQAVMRHTDSACIVGAAWRYPEYAKEQSPEDRARHPVAGSGDGTSG